VNETLASERPDILSRLYRRTTRSPVGARYISNGIPRQ
jgi:hypothetical protein